MAANGADHQLPRCDTSLQMIITHSIFLLALYRDMRGRKNENFSLLIVVDQSANKQPYFQQTKEKEMEHAAERRGSLLSSEAGGNDWLVLDRLTVTPAKLTKGSMRGCKNSNFFDPFLHFHQEQLRASKHRSFSFISPSVNTFCISDTRIFT